MKNFKCQLNVISRSSGASAVQRSAYRGGQKLLDLEKNKVFDYSYRKDVAYSAFFPPKGSPGWATFPEPTWNAAQKIDKRKNSRLARELMVSLPATFSHEAQVSVVDQIANFLVSQYAVVVQSDIHSPKIFSEKQLEELTDQHAVPIPSRPGFYQNENWHAHVMFSTREMTPSGFGKKTRVLDDRKTGRKEVERIRETVAEIINAKARELGIALNMHAKSARRRGSKNLPTKPLGQKGHWAAKHGFEVPWHKLNKEIKTFNAELEAIEAEIANQPPPKSKRKPNTGMSM
ncbi:MAG TPA: MobA/MobL family protein [Limnobacter sp.]|uniref:MobA/MobL family protein n=1 Tax=Limnobacter sp. TaxID=2003368 RepID=UPI002ED8FD15